MKTVFKCGLRLFKRQLSRFFTTLIIVVVSIGFMAGIGEVDSKISIAVNDYYKSQNIADLYIKSSNNFGFNAGEIEWISDTFGANNILKSFCYEYKEENDVVRLYNFDVLTNINKLEIVEGEYPKSDREILVERKTSKLNSKNVGEKVSIQGQEYTVCGVVLNPMLINQIEEPSFRYQDENLSSVYYINSAPIMVNDIYVSIEDREVFSDYSEDYKKTIEDLKGLVESNISDCSVLTLYENLGLYVLSMYANKVGTIAIIFVVFFLLITLLIVYSTMTRLLDEERAEIACMKTLGYSSGRIIGRYVWFVLIATLIGGILSFGVGFSLTKIIYSAFNLQYKMPPFPDSSNFLFYIISFGIIFVCNTLLTLFTGLKISKAKPVLLLSPKLAKSGRKILLERIPFIWDKLSFRHKSTLRNVFLFKVRFFMTVISVIGSTVLVFAGLGLLNCSTKIVGGESLITISSVLIVFSAVLCALVIYNLTNINISERSREISTLMVLGYRNSEVAGYIFREIYIMGAIGALFGVLFGYSFIELVFSLIEFGSVKDISWWSYVATPIITMIFCFLSTLILRKKIIKTDMNASLKSIE